MKAYHFVEAHATVLPHSQLKTLRKFKAEWSRRRVDSGQSSIPTLPLLTMISPCERQSIDTWHQPPYNLQRVEISSVVAVAYGGPEVLSVVQSRLENPGLDQVLIEVRAIGTNPVDYKLYSGAYGDDRSKLPISLGFEAAGVVAKVGGELEGPGGRIAVGDEVIVYRASGAYTTGLLSGPSSVLPKPSKMSFEEAGGLMLTGVTAIHALRATRTIAGDTLLVHGAAGGVGLMAVQLAVADGVRVIGTASEAEQERLRSLGAEPVIYGEGLLERSIWSAPMKQSTSHSPS